MTKTYILTQQVLAYEGTNPDFMYYYAPDGTTYRMKKDLFDARALEMPAGPDGVFDPSRVTLAMANAFILEYRDAKLGEKTTLVTAICRNGFEITETSSCVDAKNYNHTLGVEICKKRMIDRVWAYLGFLLQTARNGVGKPVGEPG